ncbi:TolC family protein [Pelosinus propionicus]|uniref:Outer membrane protein TolC n=1 Tax=Pelosinus propionicus DSM 13327 TaxID=1123291 RepID=A0A1I4J7P5_9FIRM|nr:TolC family protein [Pelosinus propionicus]SFL62231.1 Outer membrane protein TolC [Pelosinus propionicus DSM 13327]
MLKQTHWKKQLIAALTGGFLIFNAAIALAAPIELSLDESIEMALNSNPAIKMADAERKSAEWGISEAKGGKGPSFTYTHVDERYKKYSTTTGIPYRSNYFTNTGTLSMNLYTGGKVESAIRTAKLNLKVADLSVEESKQQIKLDATVAYFTILQAKNTVKADQETVDQMIAHLKNVQSQFDVGTVAKTDVLASQVALADNQQTLTKAQNVYNVAVATFNNVVGLPLQSEIKVKDELTHEKYNLSLEDSINYALEHRPEAIQADHNIKIAKEAVKTAKSGKLPTVTASASAFWGDTTFPGVDQDKDTWTVGLTSTWTPFDSGVTKAKIRQSDSAVVKAEQQAKQKKDSIQLAVREAYLNMIEAEKRIDTSQVTVEQAEENLKIAEVRYSAGVGTNTEVIDAQVALTKAKTNYIQAMYDFNTNKASLIKAMGVNVSDKL